MSKLGFNPSLPRNAQILELLRDGLSGKEIAQRVGASHGCVRDAIYRARKAGYLEPRKRAVAPVDPDAAWERLRAELMEAHRREFLSGGVSPAW